MDFLTIPSYHMPHNRAVRSVRYLGHPMIEQASISSGRKLVLLTAREAADYMRVSLSTLNRMEQRGLLLSLRMPGEHRRYTLEMLNECLTWIKKVEVEVG